MQKVVVAEIGCDVQTGNAVVLLSQPGESKVLPIWIGIPEARAITMAMQDIKSERPLTHELLHSLIQSMQYSVDRVEIYEIRNNAYIARILLSGSNPDDEYKVIDARPSDAIALATIASAPIFVAPAILEKATVLPVRKIDGKVPEDKDFKHFVEGLKASDFKLPGEK